MEKKFYRDWWCDNCRMKIFGSKPCCIKCGTKRPESTDASTKKSDKPKNKSDTPQKKPGDWFCPNCNEMQFAKNKNCRTCNLERPKIVEYNLRPGDWYCKGCGDLQFGNTENCKRCGVEKDSDVALDKCCVICMCALKDTLLVHNNKKGHLVACFECASDLLTRKQSCPVCKQSIITINKVYD